MEIDSIKLTADKHTKGIDENSEEEDEQYGFINNSDIQYLPYISLRKRKIEDHIYLVTSDILDTFRPINKSYKTEFPLTLHLNKDQLNNIKKEWENYKIDPNIEKVNLNNMQSTVPIDHPYRNMLFKFIPKNKEITWNECSPSPDQDSKKFVEFLQSEYSVDNSVRLIDYIVASSASAKQAFAAVLMEEAHSKKRINPDTKGSLIAILGKPGTGKSHAFTQIFEPYLKVCKETNTLKKGAFSGLHH